jgi:hypothetical protein
LEDAEEELAGKRFSLQIFSELPLGTVPILELFFTRFCEPVPFSQNIAVPSRRSDFPARRASPEVFHQPELVTSSSFD